MKSAIYLLVFFCLIFLPVISSADDFKNLLSFQGYTGLLNTPNAEVTSNFSADLMYSNNVQTGRTDNTEFADNYLVSFGFLPNLEIGGRFYNESAYVHKPGNVAIRDMSFNFKFKIPFPEKYDYFSLAVGAQDLSGGNSKFRSKYIVASKEIWRARLSVGYGVGPDYLNGFFGGIEFKLFNWLYLVGDYDTHDASVGFNLLTPDNFLNLPFSIGLKTKTNLQDFSKTDFGFFLKIPLGSNHENKKELSEKIVARVKQDSVSSSKYGTLVTPNNANNEHVKTKVKNNSKEKNIVKPIDQQKINLSENAASGINESNKISPEANKKMLGDLLVKLSGQGFENITLGTINKHELYIEYENNRYNHNQLDGLGLVLGFAAEDAPTWIENLIVILKAENIPILEVQSKLDNYRDFLLNPNAPETIASFTEQFVVNTRTPSYRSQNLQIYCKNKSPSYLKARLRFYPGLAYFAGTELSSFDASVSIRPDLYVPLWKGAGLNAQWEMPLLWTENFKKGQVFGRYRQETKLNHLSFYQTFKPFPDVTIMTVLGKYNAYNNGGLSEIIYQPGSGRHRFKAVLGYLKDSMYNIEKNISTISYRYYWDKYDLFLEGEYGKYLWRDVGSRFSIKRFFGDTSLELFARTTSSYRMGGLRFTLPLTPRQDMKPYRVQIRGDSSWSMDYNIALVGEGERGAFKGRLIRRPSLRLNLEKTYYNNDRLNPIYVKKHLLRLRDAYMKWGERN